MAKSKMTWARLANDPSINKSELPRIAKAFGLKKPTQPTRRMQTEEGDKPKKPAAKKPTAKSTRVGTTAQPLRERNYTKPKSKSVASQSLRNRNYTTGKPTATKRRSNEAPSDAGPEGAYKKRVKVVKTGGGTKSSSTKVVAVKPTREKRPRTSGPGGKR